MHSYKKLFTLFAGLFFVVTLFAKDIPQHPKLVKGTLQNGLTYYILPNDYPKGEAVYRLFIKSGSINETEDQKGLAHFLEHMAFNGTKHFPDNQLVKFLESKGAKFGRDLNAHTSYNETVYKLDLPSDTDGMVDTTLTILADWLGGLLLQENEIDAERGVIMSEWLSKQKPEAAVSDVLLDNLLNDSFFAERKVIGDTAIIQNFEYATLRDYYESWYQPNRAAVAVVGDVDPKRVEELIRLKFSGMRNKNNTTAKVHSIPDFENEEAKVIINKALKSTELTLIQLTPPFQKVTTERDYFVYLQRAMLNRLFKARLNTLSFVEDAYVKGSIGLSEFLNTKGVLMASVELKPHKVEEGIAVFMKQLTQIAKYGFLPEEIEKVRISLLNASERSAKSEQPISSARLIDEMYADFYKEYVVTTPQEEYRLSKKYLDKIDSVMLSHTLQELVKPERIHYIFSSFEENSVADSLRLMQFVDSVRNETIKPYQNKIDVPSYLLEEEPKSGKITSMRGMPEIEGQELMLSNGVRLIYKKAVSGKDRISMSAFKKGGLFSLDSADYVSGKFSSGVVSLSGAGDLSRDELSYFLAGSSASVRMMIESTRVGMAGSASLDDMETMFQLMYLKWTKPKADRSVFEMVKKRAIEDFRNKNVTDETLFYQDLNYLIKGQDYVTRVLTDSIMEEQLVFEKMLPIFDKLFSDVNGFTFVVISDIELDRLTPFISKYIASLPTTKRQVSIPFVYDGGKVNVSPAKLIRKAGDSNRAVVSLIFQDTVVTDNKSLYDLKSNMVNGVLRMRLLSELREKMGMIYSVNVSGGSRKYPSKLVRNTISFTANPENRVVLIDRVKTVLQEMIDNPDSYTTELESVKLSLKNDMSANLQKNAFWGTFVRNSIFNNNEDWNYISGYNDKVNSISAESLSEFVLKYYNTDIMVEAVLLPKEK